MEDHSSYTERITLDEGDVDYRGLMRPSALLRCAEHMATAHAWELGMDKAFYSARQMVYLVGRQAFQFLRVPAMRETVTLTTYPEKTRRGANKRVLVVGSLGGEELARVDTRWTVVDTTATKIIIYTSAAALYGIAGFLYGGKAGGASVNIGLGYELEAIAGCTIGGVSTNGGVGRIGGILIGVLVFELLKIAMQFMSVPSDYTYIVQGLVIIMAVSLDIRKYVAKK